MNLAHNGTRGAAAALAILGAAALSGCTRHTAIADGSQKDAGSSGRSVGGNVADGSGGNAGGGNGSRISTGNAAGGNGGSGSAGNAGNAAGGTASAGNGGRDAGGAGGSGDGGAAGVGRPPPDCPQVAFHVSTGGPSKFCPTGCGGLLTVLDDRGAAVGPLPGCSFLDCATCDMTLCHPGVCPPSPPLSAEEQVMWVGERWGMMDGVCPSTCWGLSCLPSGRYIARFCANKINAGDAGPLGNTACSNAVSPTHICVDVPFDYPTTATVQAVFGP